MLTSKKNATNDVLRKGDSTEDLVTLFRRKSNTCIIDQEICDIQDMIRNIIKQKQLHEGTSMIRKS